MNLGMSQEQANAYYRPGLTINGGGSAAALSAGEVVACSEEDLLSGDGFSFLMGSSAGALIMLYGALGRKEAVKMFYEDIIDAEILHPRNIFDTSGEKRGLINYDKLEGLLRDGRFQITDEDIATIQNFPIPLLAGMTPTRNNPTHTPTFFDLRNVRNRDHLIKILIASMKLPLGNIHDVEIDGEYYTDGGLGYPFSLDHMMEQDPTSLTILFNSPLSPTPHNNA